MTAPRLSATPAPNARQRPDFGGRARLRLTPGSRGVPAMVTIRETVLNDLHDEVRALRREGAEFATEVRAHAYRVHLAAVSDRPDLALHEAAAIVTAADRHLRQRGGAA